MNNLLTITVGTVKLLAKGFLFLKGTMETTITILYGAFGLLTGNINLTKTALQELKKESKITTDSMILDAIAGGAVWKNEKEKEKIIQKQTNKDLLKAAKDKTDEETDLERRKFIKTLDLQRRTTNITRSEQLQRVNNTLEHLQKESETYQLFADAKIELETANTEARLALLQQLEDKFAVGITSMLDGSANFAEAVGNIWKSITNQILGYIGQIIAKWVLLNAFTGGGVSILGAAKKVLGFAEGGVVPGNLGDPQMVLAHGGEIIAPPQKLSSAITNNMGGGTVVLNNPVFSSRRAFQEFTELINKNVKYNRKIV